MIKKKIIIEKEIPVEEFIKTASTNELLEIGWTQGVSPEDVEVVYEELIRRGREDKEGNILFEMGDEWYEKNFSFDRLYEEIKKIPLGLVQIHDMNIPTSWQKRWISFSVKRHEIIETLKSFKPSDFETQDDWEFFVEEVKEKWNVEIE